MDIVKNSSKTKLYAVEKTEEDICNALYWLAVDKDQEMQNGTWCVMSDEWWIIYGKMGTFLVKYFLSKCMRNVLKRKQ